MKILIITYSFILAYFVANKPLSIEGVWNTNNDNTKIEIKSFPNGIEGRIIESQNKNAPIGKLIVRDIKPIGKQLFSGQLYSLKYNRWANATFNRKNNQLFIHISTNFRSINLNWDLVKKP
jgi:hypothetical protein